jgi:hypothetical protein
MLLSQAHRLMAAGEFIEAGAIFERLARGAVEREIPRAPFLFVQAGKAYLEGGEKPKGFTLVKHGLKMLADTDRWGELYRVGRRTLVVLEEKGFTEESARLAAWLEEILPERSERATAIRLQDKTKHAVLPTACPTCGGPVDPAVVTWRDDVTAECLFCGSMVRAEA